MWFILINFYTQDKEDHDLQTLEATTVLDQKTS